MMLSLWRVVLLSAYAGIASAQLRVSLLDATIDDLREGLEAGAFSSVDLVKAYLGRISDVSRLNAVTELNPEATNIATVLDAERAQGKIRGPLHGIPILLKNNIATIDNNNTAGSLALLGARTPRDAFIASRLRAAGAVLLGKTGLSQWANYRSSNSSSGWSSHGGQVYGAYVENQNPSGSSSGSGVAAALGLAAGCLGTETDGSILSPAQRNGVVGIKPTVGLTSRDLVIPISEHQDTVGPIASTVKSAAYILQAIAGQDINDNYTSAIPGSIPTLPDYVSACSPSALAGARLGIPNNVIDLYLDVSDPTQLTELDAFRAALPTIRNAGALVLENTNFTEAATWSNSSAEGSVLRADFLTNLATYLSKLSFNPNNITSLADVSRFTKTIAPGPEEFPSRNTAIWDEALDPETGFNNTDPRFFPFLQKNLFLGGEGGLLGVLERHELDAVILPTSFAAGAAAIVGAPVVTVPLGYYPANASTVMNGRGNLVDTAPNVPFGISFLGRRFDEAKLIGFAYAFEQSTRVRGRVKPFLVPRTELGRAEGEGALRDDI